MYETMLPYSYSMMFVDTTTVNFEYIEMLGTNLNCSLCPKFNITNVRYINDVIGDCYLNISDFIIRDVDCSW